MGTSPRRLAGYASIFDTPDRGRDIVRRGAFQRAEPHVPLLWQHDPHRPIGRVDMLREDGRGLRVIASLSDGSRAADEALALLRGGALDGLSFGYRVKKARGLPGGGREILDLDLVEVSLVTFPMHPRARVHALSVDTAFPQQPMETGA